MRINKKSGRLRVSREKERFNPMEGMANLADVMLVFACGLIVALIFNWNVDVNSTQNAAVGPTEQKFEVEGIEGNNTQTLNEDTGLEVMGTVYKDPATGKYYVVESGGN